MEEKIQETQAILSQDLFQVIWSQLEELETPKDVQVKDQEATREELLHQVLKRTIRNQNSPQITSLHIWEITMLEELKIE